VLAALYEVADDRFLPAELRPEGSGLRYRARPRHRLRTARPARPEAATQAEWEALLEAAACWRDRFVLVLLWFGGLRIGEVLGLRRADLHFAGSSTSLGCRERGPHLHVVHRDGNPNRASAKSRHDRVVPVGAWVLAYYDRYAEERLACPAADRCDFVLVNLFHPPLGAPMTASAVRQWFRGLSRRAGLPRAIHPHMLRHSAGTEMAEAGVGIEVVRALLGHGSITSAQAYVHPSPARLREAVEKVQKVSQRRRAQRREGGSR
jgi:integrase/recombinase XerD